MNRIYINNFIKNEFSSLQFNDKRLSDRAIRTATTLLNNPESSIPVAANGSRKEVKGIYRFFQNKNVNDQNLLETHYSNTAKRIKQSKGKVLLIADSTYITPCKSRTMEKLKNIGEPQGNKKVTTRGIRVHFIMAYDLKLKEVLGITDLVMINDRDKDLERLSLRSEIDVWILTLKNTINRINKLQNPDHIKKKCIFVGDRESDFFDLLLKLKDLKINYVIRAKYNRSVEFQHSYEQKTKKISDLKSKAIFKGKAYKVFVDDYPNKKRSAIVRKRILKDIKLYAPGRHKRKDAVEASVVYVDELDCPSKKKKVEWKLLTSLSCSTEEKADFIVFIYKKRWLIEELNKCAKTGLSLEKRQFTNVEHLKPFISMVFVLSQTFLNIREMAKLENEYISKRNIFSDIELEFMSKVLNISSRKITFKEAYQYIARLGGYLGFYDSPGWLAIWKGGMKFSLLVEGYEEAFK